MSSKSKETFLLCKEEDSDAPVVTVGKKGLGTLIHYAQLRNTKDIEEELTKLDSVTVHVTCRHDFTNPRRNALKCSLESPKKKRLRSVSSFLFFCILITCYLKTVMYLCFFLLSWYQIGEF